MIAQRLSRVAECGAAAAWLRSWAQAFQFASAWWASNPYQLAQVLTYHFLPGAGRTQLNLVTPPWQQFATASNVGG